MQAAKGADLMLRVENIRKTFNKGSINEKTALDNVSLYLDEGEFVTVIGEMERGSQH